MAGEPEATASTIAEAVHGSRRTNPSKPSRLLALQPLHAFDQRVPAEDEREHEGVHAQGGGRAVVDRRLVANGRADVVVDGVAQCQSESGDNIVIGGGFQLLFLVGWSLVCLSFVHLTVAYIWSNTPSSAKNLFCAAVQPPN